MGNMRHRETGYREDELGVATVVDVSTRGDYGIFAR